MTTKLKYAHVNFKELLCERRLIAPKWDIDDVDTVRPDLTADQAWEVLQAVDRDYSSECGITWKDLEQAAYDLFGTGGARRVDRCDKALHAYSDDLPESNLIDFMADAMHWCQAKGHGFDKALAMARAHFDVETQTREE
jgi:hypothetical protein